MTSIELCDFVRENIPNFGQLKLLEEGTAYHYTTHGDSIDACGKFLGAPITPNLDFTQTSFVSQQASADPGVVFAYKHRQDADDEGRQGGLPYQIYKISYRSAISAIQLQEMELMKSLGEATPATLMILNTEITAFNRI